MAPASSPNTATPSSALHRSTASTQNMKSQRSILGFFQKSSPSTPSGARNAEPASSPAQRASEQRGASSAVKNSNHKRTRESSLDLPPVPSSDVTGIDQMDGISSPVFFSYGSRVLSLGVANGCVCRLIVRRRRVRRLRRRLDG